jgi:hypothetical protein
VCGDDLVAGNNVRRGQDGLDVLQGHVEGAEAADDLCDRDLVGLITAIAGVGKEIVGS